MADYFDNDTLITPGPGKIWLNLSCGYGQPVSTLVYLVESGGATSLLEDFGGDANALELGDIENLQYRRIKVFSTIHDIHDSPPGQEVEDIHLEIEMYSGEVGVDTSFIKRTKGKGQLVNCTYEVMIL